MRILFHLGHPAHFHLFKNVIKALEKKGHQTYILIKKKDVLEELLIEKGFDYYNILPEGRKDSKIGIAIGQIKQDFKLLTFCIKNKPDIMIGTSVAISHVGILLRIPSINVNEDDADVVPLYAKLSYPFATIILAPKGCRMGKWENKCIKYSSYHELAYLHPNVFKPSKRIASKYVIMDKPYFIMRFSRLSAHHDVGIQGISDDVALKLVEILNNYGNIYITSERELPKKFEKYKIKINPNDMHHVMSFASIFIGDSQTMAAESGVLGVPFIRFNDFVGRITYLDELENKYELGYGIKPTEIDKLFQTTEKLLKMSNRKEIFQERRKKMLKDKIDYSAFLIWFIENFPKSLEIINKNPEYQYKFK